MQAFIAIVLALVASVSAANFYTTGFSGLSGYPLSTVSYNPGFAYTNSFAPVSTGFGFSRPIYSTGLGGFNTGFGFGYRPAFSTFNTGFSGLSYPYTSTFFKK